MAAQSVSATAGTSGFIDVTLKNTGPAVTIGTFAFELTLGTPDITFTDVTTATSSAPYIFDGLGLFGPNIGTVVNGQDIQGSDTFSVIGSGTTLGTGVTVGLGHVLFDVAPGALTNSYTVVIAPFPQTSLSDDNFPVQNDVPITTLTNGQIRVLGSAAAPAPAAVLGGGVLFCLIGALAVVRRRRPVAAEV